MTLFPPDALEFRLGGLNNPAARTVGWSGPGYAARGVAAERMEAVIGRDSLAGLFPVLTPALTGTLVSTIIRCRHILDCRQPRMYSHCGSCLGATLLDNVKYLWSRNL